MAGARRGCRGPTSARAVKRANGFKTFIVSGGGIEFMRPWVEEVYGIPPEQVIGSSIKTEFGGPGPRLAVLIHHTDADREWSYDRDSHIGRLDQALDEASNRGWTVVDMEHDWTRIYWFVRDSQ